MAAEPSALVGDEGLSHIPRRVDATQVPPTRTEHGHDVGTPVPTPGVLNPDSREVAARERARAGAESIRRADAAVEAARETARIRAAECARARAEAERYAAAADALAEETRTLVANDFASLFPGDGIVVADDDEVGDGDSAVDDAARNTEPRRLRDELETTHSTHSQAPTTREVLEITRNERGAARRLWSPKGRESVDSLRGVHEKHIRRVLVSPEPGGFVPGKDLDIENDTGCVSSQKDEPTSRHAFHPETAGSARHPGNAEDGVGVGTESLGAQKTENSPSTYKETPRSVFAPSPVRGRRVSTQKTPPSTPPRLVPHTAHDTNGTRKPRVPRFHAVAKTTPGSAKRGVRETETNRKEKAGSKKTRVDPQTLDPTRRPVAFIGVTPTGAAMCARLLDHGFPVVVAPATHHGGFESQAERKRAATLQKHGATLAKSPRHAVELCVLGRVDGNGFCNGFFPKAWAPGVRCKDRRDAARCHDGENQPSPLIILRAGEEDEDDEVENYDHEGDEFDDANDVIATTQKRLLTLDSVTAKVLDDIFPPHSQRALSENRSFFGGSLIVLNLNSSTRVGVEKNCDRLVNQLGVSFVQAATRGDAFDAEDGAMRIAIAALDVVPFERRREALRKRNGQSTVPKITRTGALCGACPGRHGVGALNEMSTVLARFAGKADRLLFHGKHPVEAAVVGSYFAGYGDAEYGDAEYDGQYQEEEEEEEEEDDVSSSSNDDVSADGVSETFSKRNHKAPFSFERNSPTSASTWRLADARATARARHRNLIASAPVTAKLLELESTLEKARAEFSETKSALRGEISTLESERDFLRDEVHGAKELVTANALLVTQIAELKNKLASTATIALASENDAFVSAARYEATERELGEALVLVEDLRVQHSKEIEKFQTAQMTQNEKAHDAFAVLAMERDALEVTLRRREVETNAANDAFALRDDALRAQNAAEVIAAAAVAEKNVATAAAVETVATLRGRVVKLEGCVAVASGREAAALGEAEAATEEANACRRVAAAAVKDAAARAEVSAKRETEFRVRLEDAVTKASAAEACVVSLEKNADTEHNKWLQFKRDASKREKNLIAEREIGLCEIAGIKTALRRLSKENDKLSSLIGLIKKNGRTVDAVGFHDESKSNSPWRPSGPTPGSAVYQPPSSAKKVSLKGLLRAKSPGRNRSGDSVSPTKGHANASALSFQSPTHSTNNTPVKEPYKEPVSSGRLVAKLEAAERQIVGLTSALANGDESVTKERDALAEKLSKSHREKARVAAEVVRLKTQITDMKATLEARGLERTSVTAALQALHVTYSAVQHDLREQTQNRAASSKVAERYILEVATHEAKVVLLRDENEGLIHELTDMQTKFGVLGRSEAAARVERHQAETLGETFAFEKETLRETLRVTKNELDALQLEHKKLSLDLVRFKNGAMAKQWELATHKALVERDLKHSEHVGLLLAERAFETAAAECTVTVKQAECRKETHREHLVLDAAVAAAARSQALHMEAQIELETANSPFGDHGMAPPTASPARVTNHTGDCASPQTRNRAVAFLAFPSTMPTPRGARSSPRIATPSPTIATQRDLIMETLRLQKMELATMVATRRALELALETKEVLAALESLRAGDADPSPATALACHLVKAMLAGSDDAKSDSLNLVTEEDVAARALGEWGFSIKTPGRYSGGNGGYGGYEYVSVSLSPNSVRTALGRCFLDGSDDLERTRAAVAFAGAFDSIRPFLGKTLPQRMQRAVLDPRDTEGLQTATNAVRVLMMNGGFNGIDGMTSTSERKSNANDNASSAFQTPLQNETDTWQTSGDPLAQLLFRWSACAVREWRLRVKVDDATQTLRSVDETDAHADADASSDEETEKKRMHETLLDTSGRRKSKSRRIPLVVRAPVSPEDARKIARHGAARVLARTHER